MAANNSNYSISMCGRNKCKTKQQRATVFGPSSWSHWYWRVSDWLLDRNNAEPRSSAKQLALATRQREKMEHINLRYPLQTIRSLVPTTAFSQKEKTRRMEIRQKCRTRPRNLWYPPFQKPQKTYKGTSCLWKYSRQKKIAPAGQHQTNRISFPGPAYISS